MDFAFFSEIEKTKNDDINANIGALIKLNLGADERLKKYKERIRLMNTLQSNSKKLFAGTNHEDLYAEQHHFNSEKIKSLENEMARFKFDAESRIKTVEDNLKQLGYSFKDRQISIDIQVDKFKHIDNESGFRTESGMFNAKKFYQIIEDMAYKHKLVNKDQDKDGYKDIMDWAYFEPKDEIEYDNELTAAFSFSQKDEAVMSAFFIELAQSLNEEYFKLRREYLMSSECDYIYRDLEGDRAELVDKELALLEEVPCTASGRGAMNFYGKLEVSLSRGNTLAEISEAYANDKEATGICENMTPHFVVHQNTEIGRQIKEFYGKTFGTVVDGKNYGRSKEGYQSVSQISASEFLVQNPKIDQAADDLISSIRVYHEEPGHSM